MIHIDCSGCGNHCCGRNPSLTPVLLPSEEDRFKEHSVIVRTPNRELRVLAKKENGNCVFLDDKAMRCTVYGERPLECKLYPFLLDFSKEKPDAKLDRRFCPHLRTLQFGRGKISEFIKKHSFPEDWIKAYESLEGY